MTEKLKSLTIFFPFYNDAGTVKRAIADAYRIGSLVATDLEVIALHGGASKDDTYKQVVAQQKKYPDLRVRDKRDNTEGYAVIKHGFAAATKEWIFYTDGDLQYSLTDLPKLVKKQHQTGADVVNGCKLERGDSFFRTFFGYGYGWFSRVLFQLPIRDTDCDFRLIRRSIIRKIKLEAQDSSILPELVKKLQLAGATFAEVPVHHSFRTYGKSSYSVFALAREKIIGDIRLWKELRKNSHDR